jgi:hypothetical protein
MAQQFAFLTQLTSLFFYFDSILLEVNKAVEFVHQALRHLTSQQLRRLAVTISPVEPELRDRQPWTDLGLLLESPRFLPTLRVLKFRLSRPTSRVSVEVAAAREQWIAASFPLYTARGILSVQSLDLRAE